MKRLTSTIGVYSPRWGRIRPYVVVFDAEGITVEDPDMKSARFSGEAREWSGYGRGEQPLLSIIHNAGAPCVSGIESYVRHIWESWREGGITADEATARLLELEAWANKVVESRPMGDFWLGFVPKTR